jgi:hypothetical protein
MPYDDEFEEDPYASQPKPAVSSRSRADDVLDAVGGVRRKGLAHDCPTCHIPMTVRGGMGSSQYLFCRKCRLEIPWAGAPPIENVVELPQAEGPFSGPGLEAPNEAAPPHRMAMEKLEEDDR